MSVVLFLLEPSKSPALRRSFAPSLKVRKLLVSPDNGVKLGIWVLTSDDSHSRLCQVADSRSARMYGGGWRLGQPLVVHMFTAKPTVGTFPSQHRATALEGFAHL